MTVSDWYEQHQKYGALPDRGLAKPTPGMKQWEEDGYAASSLHLPNYNLSRVSLSQESDKNRLVAVVLPLKQ